MESASRLSDFMAFQAVNDRLEAYPTSSFTSDTVWRVGIGP